MSYQPFERDTEARLRRIEAKLDALAAALGGPAKKWCDYATNHGTTHPTVSKRLYKAGRDAGTRGERSSGTAR
jgi:head-tail adaptor